MEKSFVELRQNSRALFGPKLIGQFHNFRGVMENFRGRKNVMNLKVFRINIYVKFPLIFYQIMNIVLVYF